MKLADLLHRLRSLFFFTRIFFSRWGGSTIHICELLISAYISGLPRVSLDKLLREIQMQNGCSVDQIHLHPQLRGRGSGSVAEMAALAALVAAKRPQAILEFGTCDGFSTWHLRFNSAPEARITTIDLPPGTKVSGSSDPGFQGVTERPFLPTDSNLTLIETDSRQWNAAIPGGVDFCFIDAGHTHECVKNDTEKAFSVMNKNGIVVWHDATWRLDGYAVNRYLTELRKQGFHVRLIDVDGVDYCGLAVLVFR